MRGGQISRDESIQRGRRRGGGTSEVVDGQFQPFKTSGTVLHKRGVSSRGDLTTSRKDGGKVRLTKSEGDECLRFSHRENQVIQLPKENRLSFQAGGHRCHLGLSKDIIKYERNKFGVGFRDTLKFMDNQ